MAKELMPHLTLEQARQLVRYLENEDVASANGIVESANVIHAETDVVFDKVGELTRELHDALQDFRNDTRLMDLAGKELPEAENRLNYVIKMTGEAANTTMDAVDVCLPIADKLVSDLESISPNWQALMTRQLALGDFKKLCHQVEDLLKDSEQGALSLRASLMDILMAQGFQDLTGQIISRVISLVQEIEIKLVQILTVCSAPENIVVKEETDQADISAEGPIIDASTRDDVVNGQDDVDDLLSSLGF
ncbi:chemotaxis protein CheZ [Psychromonas sp. CNPT3]|uniref:protein phosphatase CheZ n=1 Tax=Psychromonas sp. CNPT3 TaxID=314282 RepID=UPI00006E78A4|nr:protein phosphatase CheZ [Psychromonas sp. CNPT3]AGH82039.1 chemotaxis protein CheZ [Psychromonas sp. CNPT3]